MSWLKKNLSFTVIMVLLAGALGFEIYLMLGQRAKAREAEDSFHQKVEEFQRLVNQPVLPHQRNVDLTETEIERQREELELYAESLKGREGLEESFGDHPASGRDFVFDIQFFAEEYRQRAVAATGMEPEDLEGEYFGFGAYSATGPADSRLAAVYKQRLVVAYILDQIFEARPERLISVRRPGGGSGEGERGEAAGAFRLDPKLSAAIPDIAETSPYEVTFTGRASTLRTFINELASFEMPLIVRSVQVAPAGEGRTTRAADTSTRRRRAPAPEAPAETEEDEGEDENVPLVADNLSRFTVAMELIDLVPLEGSQ